MKRYHSSHMVRMENLNHHGNLYAGQGIEWMIETSFIVVCTEYGDPQGLLYKNTHKFDFCKSVIPGDIITYEGLIVRTGRTSLTLRVGLYNEKTGVLHAEGGSPLSFPSMNTTMASSWTNPPMKKKSNGAKKKTATSGNNLAISLSMPASDSRKQHKR